MIRKISIAAILTIPLVWVANVPDQAFARDNDLVVGNSNGGALVVGSGRLSDTTRNLPAFRKIALDIPVDLTVRQGAEARLVLRGDDNLLGLIETNLHGDTLSLETHRHFRTHHRFTAVLTVPSLDGLAINAAGDVRFQGWRGRSLALDIGGAGKIVLDGSVDEVNAVIAGAGKIDLTAAHIAKASADIRGTGSIMLGSLDRLDAEVRGTGQVDAGDVGQLSAVINGMGNIGYRSAGNVVRREVHGIGTIAQR